MSIFAGAVDYFVKGGPCMWPLLMCSFAAIAIGVERYLFYKKAISGEKFASSFCRMMNDFNLVGASELAEQSKGEAAAMAKEILDIKGDLGQRLETIVYTKADRIIDSLEKNINYLSVVIGLSPMLGLLGTITGMISSFIGEALITTVFGLCIAIMGMCIHAYLTSKIKTETLNINEVADTLVDIFKANEQSK